MAVDKLVDSVQLDSNLESVADAIRTKGGTSAGIAFPSGFISAINAISTGAEFVKGSFTVGDNDTSHTINFGKTFSKYLFIIEADTESKETILNTGLSSSRAYMSICIFPGVKIASDNVDYQIIVERIKPSDSSLTITNKTSSTYYTLSDSSITIKCYAVTNTNAPDYLYQGLTYNYYVFEIK